MVKHGGPLMRGMLVSKRQSGQGFGAEVDREDMRHHQRERHLFRAQGKITNGTTSSTARAAKV